jgi:uncharacterized protein
MTTTAPRLDENLPVTVSFTRRADPANERQMVAWIRAGLAMAETFPGFLGAGWVRAGRSADEWHMLCRFENQRALGVWEASMERQWWLRSGQGLAEITRTERRTGIEGWFDRPVAAEVSTPTATAPPRWKQATTIWLVFFPLNLLVTVTLGVLLEPFPVVLRVFLFTLALTPLMTYVLLPWITRRLSWWLQGRRWRDRRAPAAG